MKNKLILTTVLSVFALSGVANAQTTGSGTLGVTATVVGTLNLTFATDPSGIAVTGTGTGIASMPFGNVQMFGGTPAAHVTKTVNGMTSFTLATPFDIRMDLANTTSATYSLSAALSTADATNTWSVAGVNISNGAPFAITATGAYATASPYVFNLTIPATETAGLITNTINFTATSN
jgi:hypothetical protein